MMFNIIIFSYNYVRPEGIIVIVVTGKHVMHIVYTNSSINLFYSNFSFQLVDKCNL